MRDCQSCQSCSTGRFDVAVIGGGVVGVPSRVVSCWTVRFRTAPTWLIVGCGPAGLAAVELRARGVVSVTVLDREAQAGGIPRHCAHSPYGLRELRRIMSGPVYAARLVARARAAGVAIHTGVTVTAVHQGPRLSLSTAGGLREITARQVLLCTGTRESSRAARLIGGAKPGGVISTGALQAMVHLHGLQPFRRPVVLGTELSRAGRRSGECRCQARCPSRCGCPASLQAGCAPR
jgi:2-polyprenyl-6-methoxyphenol hydroxylase-like FAD-dependent oxidoreductase